MSDFMISARVRAIRLDRGMTQDELAGMTGMTRGTIANIETGRADPSLSLFVRIAKALGVDTAELLSEPTCPRCAGNPPDGYACLRCWRRGSDPDS